ncbi:MAG: DUF1173 domain-containing protein [Rhizobacter sp.]|nr:DUF1173 domain-containing protein [Rhizobacter sp.]
MEGQRFSILGQAWTEDDPGWQSVLARAHDTTERPRCLCVPGGVEMYVARHGQLVVKRMPDSGSRHHPACPSYELPAQASGLEELLGEAVIESETGEVDLRVDFPWTRTNGRGRGSAQRESDPAAEVAVERRCMSLRALMHYLFERAGFNRWTPAMEGRRNQGVLHKYLMEAAADVSVKGEALVDRLYVPEPFSEATRAEASCRRRQKLALLRHGEGSVPLALVMGEFKLSEPAVGGHRVWVKHMPDAPLLADDKAWRRIERAFAPVLQAPDADTGHKVRLMLAALVRARREYTYQIDAAYLMLMSEEWIPLEGVHEVPLVQALVAQRRRFLKPLRYDARSAAGFANALLLDAGPGLVPLHLVSGFMSPTDRGAKERSLARADGDAWVWRTDRPMPPLPAVSTASRSASLRAS